MCDVEEPRKAYCVKCRSQRDMIEPRQIMNKRNVPMLQSNCGVCNRVINTFIKKEGGSIQKKPRIRKKKEKKTPLLPRQDTLVDPPPEEKEEEGPCEAPLEDKTQTL